MAFELETTLGTGVSGDYWYLGYVEVICNDNPFVNVSMDLYLNKQAKLDGKSIMERRSIRMSLYDIDASVSYDFRACVYNALIQRPEWATATMIYDDPTQNPKCQDAAYSTPMETPVAITVGAYDPYNVPFTFSIVNQPTNGSVSIEMAHVDFGAGDLSNPVFVYTPNASYAGLDSFTYTATNDQGFVGNTSTITINIPTQIPVASSFNVSTDVNVDVDFTMNGNDPNGLPLTYSVISGTNNGTYLVSDNVISYSPNADFVGSDSLQYTASNGTYLSPAATISIAVNAVVPVASDVTSSTTKNISVDISGSATDPKGLPLTYSVDTSPANGIVSVNNDIFNYTPNTDYLGSDSFTYKVTNGTQESIPASVTIVVGE